MTSPTPPPARSDARRNREEILRVAKELFAESDDFALSEVARRAGVGQGTLYRHFRDRAELAAAVFDEHVAHLERVAAEQAGDPEAFFVMIRSLVERLTHTHALRDLARRDTAVGSALTDTRMRVRELMAGPVRDAKAAGLLRPDVTVDDALLIVSMVIGAIDGVEGPAARATAASRALALALSGAASSAPR